MVAKLGSISFINPFSKVFATNNSSLRQKFEEHYLKKKKEEFENERALRKKRPLDRDEADKILVPHSLWSEDETDDASRSGTEEASEEEDEAEVRRKNLYDEPDDDANDNSISCNQEYVS